MKTTKVPAENIGYVIGRFFGYLFYLLVKVIKVFFSQTTSWESRKVLTGEVNVSSNSRQ